MVVVLSAQLTFFIVLPILEISCCGTYHFRILYVFSLVTEIFQCKNTISRTIQNGHVEGTAPQFTVRCHRGFQLIGDAQVTCTSNTTSTCVPKCLRKLSCKCSLIALATL